jgi:hypothetical protein
MVTNNGPPTYFQIPARRLLCHPYLRTTEVPGENNQINVNKSLARSKMKSKRKKMWRIGS